MLAFYRKRVKYWEIDWAFHGRATTSNKVDIILANRINSRSSTSQNLLEPKCHLALAITFEILAFYRNLVKCWEKDWAFYPSPTSSYMVDIILANRMS
jgi:hypothetical protein